MPRGLHVIIITIIVIMEIIMVKLASGCQPILVPLRRISKKPVELSEINIKRAVYT